MIYRTVICTTSNNKVFVAHFIRTNWLTPNSQTPKVLGEIQTIEGDLKNAR